MKAVTIIYVEFLQSNQPSPKFQKNMKLKDNHQLGKNITTSEQGQIHMYKIFIVLFVIMED